MPIVYIKRTKTVQLVEPGTGKQIVDANGQPQEVSFDAFVLSLMDDPAWSNGYEAARAQRAIEQALVKSVGKSCVELSAEDARRLKDCVEKPRKLVAGPFGPQETSGFRWHPSIAGQLVAHMDAIANPLESVSLADADVTEAKPA